LTSKKTNYARILLPVISYIFTFFFSLVKKRVYKHINSRNLKVNFFRNRMIKYLVLILSRQHVTFYQEESCSKNNTCCWCSLKVKWCLLKCFSDLSNWKSGCGNLKRMSKIFGVNHTSGKMWTKLVAIMTPPPKHNSKDIRVFFQDLFIKASGLVSIQNFKSSGIKPSRMDPTPKRNRVTTLLIFICSILKSWKYQNNFHFWL